MADPVRSVTHAFSILRLLAGSDPLTLSEVSRGVGTSLSTCLNLMTTLVEERAVERNDKSKRYRLAPGWNEFAALKGDAAQELAERAQPLLDRFAEDCDAAAGLWKVISRDRVQLLVHAAKGGGMRLSLEDGQRQPLGSGAVGRALAASQDIDEKEMRRRYAPVRWQADLAFETYRSQIGHARQDGFAVDRDFAYRGICSIAVPISGVGPGLCLSASIFSGSRNDAEIASLGTALVGLRSSLVGTGLQADRQDMLCDNGSELRLSLDTHGLTPSGRRPGAYSSLTLDRQMPDLQSQLETLSSEASASPGSFGPGVRLLISCGSANLFGALAEAESRGIPARGVGRKHVLIEIDDVVPDRTWLQSEGTQIADYFGSIGALRPEVAVDRGER